MTKALFKSNFDVFNVIVLAGSIVILIVASMLAFGTSNSRHEIVEATQPVEFEDTYVGEFDDEEFTDFENEEFIDEDQYVPEPSL